MEQNQAKPTFGVNETIIDKSDVDKSNADKSNVDKSDVVKSETKNLSTKSRPEVGAIWERSTSINNKRYLKLKLNFSKEKLQKILDSSEEEVNLTLVAFRNEYKEVGDNRPTFRIYEELKS
jgi:uncharacterized protein (DUF736 family)